MEHLVAIFIPHQCIKMWDLSVQVREIVKPKDSSSLVADILTLGAASWVCHLSKSLQANFNIKTLKTKELAYMILLKTTSQLSRL